MLLPPVPQSWLPAVKLVVAGRGVVRIQTLPPRRPHPPSSRFSSPSRCAGVQASQPLGGRGPLRLARRGAAAVALRGQANQLGFAGGGRRVQLRIKFELGLDTDGEICSRATRGLLLYTKPMFGCAH